MFIGEGAFNKLAADIKIRKQDGIVFDSNLLDIDENRIIIKFLENGGPVIVIIYMVQQINCIKNRKGEIIEVYQHCKIFRYNFYCYYYNNSICSDYNIYI